MAKKEQAILEVITMTPRKKKYRIDFKMQAKSVKESVVKDGKSFSETVTLKGTLGDTENQCTITLTIVGQPGSVDEILSGMNIENLDDVVSGEFKMIQRQASLWNIIKEKESEDESEDNEESLESFGGDEDPNKDTFEDEAVEE